MSSQTIAWIGIASISCLTVALECLRRYLVRRNRPLTASEWLEAMRKLPPSTPPRRTQEGKATKPAARHTRGRVVLPKSAQAQIEELERLK